MFASIAEVESRFAQAGYIADHQLAAATFLAVCLRKPIVVLTSNRTGHLHEFWR